MRVSAVNNSKSDRVGRDHSCVVGERPVVVFDDLRRGWAAVSKVLCASSARLTPKLSAAACLSVESTQSSMQAAEHDLVDTHPAERLLKRCVVKGAAVALGHEDIRTGPDVQLLHQLPLV